MANELLVLGDFQVESDSTVTANGFTGPVTGAVSGAVTTSALTFPSGGATLTDGSATAQLDPALLAGGEVVLLKRALSASDVGTTVAMFTVPAGQVLIVKDVYLYCSTLFDGTTPTAIVGTAVVSADPDGFIPSYDLTSAGAVGFEHDARGALLYDAVNDHDIDAAMFATARIDVTLGGSGSTVGAAYVFVHGVLVTL